MTERIIDALEPVEIEAKHGELFAVTQPTQTFLQLFTEEDAVGQIRQLVVPRQVGDVRFRLLPLRNVFMDRDPSAIGGILMRDRHHPSVGERLDDVEILCRSRSHPGESFLGALGERFSLDQILQNRLERRARRAQRFRQAVHRAVAAVADDQFALGVEHAQTVRHVVQRHVELHVDLFELHLALEQLLAVVLEYLNGASHVAEFVPVVPRRHRFGRRLFGQPAHVNGDALEPAKHATHDGQAERSNQHQRGEGAGRHPKQQRPRAAEQRRDRGIGDVDLVLAVLMDLVFQVVGDLAVYGRLLQRLVLREIIGVEHDLLTGFHQVGYFTRDLRLEAVGHIVRLFRIQLFKQRGKFRALGDETALAEFEARPHDLGGRTFDDLAVLSQKRLQTSRIFHRGKCPLTEPRGGSLGYAERNGSTPRQESRPRASTAPPANTAWQRRRDTGPRAGHAT